MRFHPLLPFQQFLISFARGLAGSCLVLARRRSVSALALAFAFALDLDEDLLLYKIRVKLRGSFSFFCFALLSRLVFFFLSPAYSLIHLFFFNATRLLSCVCPIFAPTCVITRANPANERQYNEMVQ